MTITVRHAHRMSWLIAGVVIVAALAAFLHFGAKPAMHRHRSLADLESFLTSLELGGQEGALLLIEHEASDRFVQIVRTDAAPGPAALTISFPVAPRSRAFEAPVRDAFLASSCPICERVGSDGMRFLDADQLSVPQAAALIRRLVQAMGLGEEARYTLHFEGPIRSPDTRLFIARLATHRADTPHA